MLSAEETLRRLTIGEPALLPAIATLEGGDRFMPRLDARTESLIRVGALVALDAAESSYQTEVEAAMLAGASLDDLVATLLAVAGSVGAARIVSAAPRLALAAGYDVDFALECREAPAS